MQYEPRYLVYPGVAAVCKEIQANPERSLNQPPLEQRRRSKRWYPRACLGDIGPEAAMPVMEGKALLFKHLGGVDAFPICLNTKDPDEIVKACKQLEPSFGGINLEDIASPKCFYVLEKACKELNIPVWHDDQQGTATVILAGLMNAFKIVGKNLKIASSHL